MSDPIESRPLHVTFFEDRAEVVRSARADVPAGTSTLQIEGITPLLHDASLQVRCEGAGVRVASARVTRRLESAAAPGLRELPAIEEERRAAGRRRESAERALQRAHGEQVRALALERSFAEVLRRVPEGAALHAADLRAGFSLVDGQLAAGLDDAAAAAGDIAHARLDEERAVARLSLASARELRAVTRVEVQLDAAAAGAIELRLTYQTPCALWRPEHLARLRLAEGGAAELELRTWATAWQRTGEEWADVPCRFSTARPAQPASPPLLRDDVLQSRRKTAEERKTVVVEAREEVVQLAGLQRGARVVDEMPGVEDGGEPRLLEGLRPATIPSDGQPVRIEVARLVLPCVAERIALPEQSPAVHVRATATLSGKEPLLAGPVLLVRRTEAVGRGRVGFVGAGEPFELGFGVDDGLRVRRQQHEVREVTPVIGTQKITRTVELFVSNLGAEGRTLVLQERIPVSEIEDVKVHIVEWPGRPPDAQGFARHELTLAAGATRKLSLVYRIEASSRVQLPAG